jgi:hypothetical protein
MTMSMTDQSSGVLRVGALHDIQKAREAAPTAVGLDALEREVTHFYDSIGELDADLARIEADTTLSAEGKQRKRDAVTTAWRDLSARRVAEVEIAAARLTARDEAKVTPRPPVDDPVALEAKLANARSDALMLLEGADVMDLPERMRELVEHDADPAVSYLLVGTPWSTHLIRSRLRGDGRHRGGQGDHSALLLWEQYRHRLARHLLDDDGKREWDRVEALWPLGRVRQVVAATRQFALKDRGWG